MGGCLIVALSRGSCTADLPGRVLRRMVAPMWIWWAMLGVLYTYGVVLITLALKGRHDEYQPHAPARTARDPR